MTYAERATTYAEDVVAGRVSACLFVRQACQRHLSDLKAKKSPYRFDAPKANKVCAFVELMPHVKGRWARSRESIRLEDWQCFLIGMVFGWVRKKDGLRRYRRVYIEVPRKNAKSTLSAALGLYMLTADGEHGAEIYSGATTEKQAWEVFGPARLMAKQTPAFLQAYGVEVNARSITVEATASKFEPVIGKPGDGASPTFSITDEYHEHQTDEQYDTMVTGMGAREQPIAWVITTAGVDTAGPCYALRQEVVEVLNATVENDELFGVIYTVDEGEEWSAPPLLPKANPNIGVSVSEEFLTTQQRDAVNNPRKQSTFKTKHLNVWVGAAAPFFNLELWNRLADRSLKREDFQGEPSWKGLDLASKLDIAADVTLFRREINGALHWYAFGRFYIPEERAMDPDKRSYMGWSEQGHLTTTPGAITDYGYIEDDIRRDVEGGDLVQVGVDPHNATYLITRLQDFVGEDRVLEVPQTTLHLSEPMKEIQALIEDGRIHHDGNPAFAWMIGNVTAQMDRNDNVFPRKERPENKIDGAVALIIAMGCAMRSEPAGASIYEEQGIDWI